MKPAIRRLHFNALPPLISLFDRNHLAIYRPNAYSFTVGGICQHSIARNSLPSLGGKNAATGMCDSQQILAARVKTHRYQSANEKMFGL
ncbi:MAG: hypothetical protein P4N60_10545 [Verrucomicrobiae bacterium]|nr:hypothetical protein [Verrucomicrobiae bacterium]